MKSTQTTAGLSIKVVMTGNGVRGRHKYCPGWVRQDQQHMGQPAATAMAQVGTLEGASTLSHPELTRAAKAGPEPGWAAAAEAARVGVCGREPTPPGSLSERPD